MLAYGLSAYIHYVLSCVCLCISNSRRLLYVRTCLQVPVCVTVSVPCTVCTAFGNCQSLWMHVCTYIPLQLYKSIHACILVRGRIMGGSKEKVC